MRFVLVLPEGLQAQRIDFASEGKERSLASGDAWRTETSRRKLLPAADPRKPPRDHPPERSAGHTNVLTLELQRPVTQLRSR